MLLCAAILTSVSLSVSGVTENNVTGALRVMQGYYKKDKGEWGDGSWWHSANALEALCNVVLYTNNTEYFDTVQNTWDRTQNSYKKHKTSEGYDDILWWGLAWSRAAHLTNNTTYLTRSEGYYSEANETWDTTCGGGVWWNRDKTYKNAITNELYLTLATELYKATNKRQYLTDAHREWNWFVKSKIYGHPSSLIVDGLSPACDGTGSLWTYNQGVLLGGLLNLYKLTGDITYLTHAFKKTDKVLEAMTAQGILQEPALGGGKTSDAEQFKGVFARYAGYLLRGSHPVPLELSGHYSRLKSFVLENAGSVLENDVTGNGRFGFYWEGPPDKPSDPDYITHCSGLDIVTAAFNLP